MRNNIILHLMFYCITMVAQEQSISIVSIDSCYKWAKNNYPMAKQIALIERSMVYSISNAQKGYLPQINLSGYSTYQSEVLTFPFNLPGSSIGTLRKDQHRVYGEFNQPLTDLLNVENQKNLSTNNAEIESQKTEVELYKLKDRINQIFFGILLIDAQIKQISIIKSDLLLAIEKIQTSIDNGIGLQSNLELLKVELLKCEQRIDENKANKRAYIKMLSLFVCKEINENTILITPVFENSDRQINRPELKLFLFQQKGFDIQSRFLKNKIVPKINLFFQGGYGAPGLNTINNNPATYYITGIKLNWNLSSLYTYKKEQSILDINKKILDFQKETFILNTNITLSQQEQEIEKFKSLINSDNEIINLRIKIKSIAQGQLSNGVITASDFLNQLNAEDQARQNLVLHQINLLFAQFNFQTTLGN